jgi:hypothetical protein
MAPVLYGEAVASGNDQPGGVLLLIGSFLWDIYCELWGRAIFIPKPATLLCTVERVNFCDQM